MTYDVEYLFKCLLPLHIFLVRCLQVFGIFQIGYLFLIPDFRNSLRILYNSHFTKYIFYQNIFFPVCGLPALSLEIVFYRAKVFLNCNEVQVMLFLPLIIPLVLCISKSLAYSQGHLDFLLYYLLGIL